MSIWNLFGNKGMLRLELCISLKMLLKRTGQTRYVFRYHDLYYDQLHIIHLTRAESGISKFRNQSRVLFRYIAMLIFRPSIRVRRVLIRNYKVRPFTMGARGETQPNKYTKFSQVIEEEDARLGVAVSLERE